MSDIRYFCLSDMHLGEEGSILTNLKEGSSDADLLKPSPALTQLVGCWRHLIEETKPAKKPTLILLGDILELALTTTNQAAMGFERFVELIMPPGGELFDRIIYVPGNHDHHLWETAREIQYANYLKASKPPRSSLPIPWHTTYLFDTQDAKPVPSYFLTTIVQRYPHLRDKVVETAYPNYGLVSENSQRSVVFHHGHFTESLYQLVSNLMDLAFADRQKPVHIWDIEDENFAWIDFFWSMLGQSGQAGKQIELIYKKTHDRDQLKKLLNTLADNLARKFDLPGPGDFVEAFILKSIFGAAADRIVGAERVQTKDVLSSGSRSGLRKYLAGPLKDQILLELDRNMPSDVTFVFGHTHKPYEENIDNVAGYPEWLGVYNTGGWVVDTPEPQPLHGGAVLLIDEDLNTISLRMYNETADPQEYRVKVAEAAHAGKHSTFYHQIFGLVDSSQEPWKAFSDTVSREVDIRVRNFQAKVKYEGPSN